MLQINRGVFGKFELECAPKKQCVFYSNDNVMREVTERTSCLGSNFRSELLFVLSLSRESLEYR